MGKSWDFSTPPGALDGSVREVNLKAASLEAWLVGLVNVPP